MFGVGERPKALIIINNKTFFPMATAAFIGIKDFLSNFNSVHYTNTLLNILCCIAIDILKNLCFLVAAASRSRPVPFIPRDGTGRDRDGIFKMGRDCAFAAYEIFRCVLASL